MKIEYFTENHIEQLGEFMSDETKTVKRMFLSSKAGREDMFYVFYEEAEEQLNKEKEELGKLDKIAIRVESDIAQGGIYAKLKNSMQRELFLLSAFDLPSSQAKKVIELLNVRKIRILEEDNK